MKTVSLLLLIIVILVTSCKTTPPSEETLGEIARRRVEEEKRRRGEFIPDYTVDWRKIANLAGETEYDPYITDIVWRRFNWRDYLSGKASTELIADWEREYKWNKRIRDWEAQKMPAEPADEPTEEESESESEEGE